MTAISRWATNPWFWPVVFFALSAAGSAYAGEVRAFLKVPPYKFRRFLLNRKIKRLELLERLHENGDGLISWRRQEFLASWKFIRAVWVGIFVSLGVAVMAHPTPGKIRILGGVFIAVAAGTFLATICRGYGIVTALRSYERSVDALKARIEELSASIAKG